MSLLEFLRTAMIALRRNVLRSVLTTLGIIIGVGSVIVMSAIGGGASRQIEQQIASLGTNQLTIFPGSMNVGGRQGGFGSAPPLTEKDLRAIRERVDGVVAVAGNMTNSATLVAGSSNWVTQVQGSSAEVVDVRDWPLASGRFYDAIEAAARRKVVVIGSTVARELFGSADPVGTTLRVNNVPFEIIGVLKSKGQAGGRDQDDVIFVPLQTARSRLMGRVRVPDEVGQIQVKVDDDHDLAEVQSDLERLLRERRRVAANAQDNFAVRNFADILATRSATQRTLGLLLASAAAISLIVGGIGIMNIMLVSVTERTREIGLRMAIGARGGDILGQFLTEAVLLSILASAAVGVIFGYVPARRASQLNPIEALRYE